jgi:O-acetyl-ADP-ribose deacetylase (regulator of RNase III)
MENFIVEVQGNLFDCDQDFSLVHCVSKDFKMGKGIALAFRERFGRVEEFKSQNVGIGGTAWISTETRCLFYLVTKDKYNEKPTYDSLRSCLETTKELCNTLAIKKLAMPRIGCGLDRLNWDTVHSIILETFENTGVLILIYTL